MAKVVRTNLVNCAHLSAAELLDDKALVAALREEGRRFATPWMPTVAAAQGAREALFATLERASTYLTKLRREVRRHHKLARGELLQLPRRAQQKRQRGHCCWQIVAA